MPSKLVIFYKIYWDVSDSGVELRFLSHTLPLDPWDADCLDEVELDLDEDYMPVASIITKDTDLEHKEVFLRKLSEVLLEDIDNLSKALSTRKKLLNNACANPSKVTLEG